MDIAHWLERLGLAQYAAAFAANAIDTAMLAGLTTDDLKEIGVGPLGHRKRILEAIAALGDAGPPGLAEAPARAPIRTREAERRQLTVMFVDLVGSTALSRRLDPEDMGQILKAYQNAVVGEISRLDGFTAKLMGDGVLAYFGWPKAHEDEAERAVRAGLAIVGAVAKLEAPEPLACRVGIATGLVVVGDLIGEGASQEEAVVGDTPNLAARLQALAEPGQVVVAEATRRLLGTGFTVEPLGSRSLGGIAEPVLTYRVTGERALESRFASRAGETVSPMVGRDEELALLLRQWREAVAGEGRAVLVVGEAGIGKSRLIRALREAVLPDRPTVLLYQCSPFHADSPLWPVTQQLAFAARFEPGDDALTRRAKLAQVVAEGERLDLLASLLGIPGDADPSAGLDPRERRLRTLQALVEQLGDLATRAPVLVLMEDVHWVDPSTIELLQRTLEAVASCPVLVVLTSRPEAEPALGSFPHLARLVVSRLGRAAVEAMVGRLLEAGAMDAEVRAQILARTDGVPLFVEELTKAVLEASPAGQGITVPATLQDSLLARLDRDPVMRSVGQVAACIGREFDHALLASVAEMTATELGRGLESLVESELVYRRGSGTEASYSFKHALVRDAAYESLLRSRRVEIHRRVASILEKRMFEEEAGAPGLIAQHLAAAGEPERAIRFWQMAGDQARSRFANREAIIAYGRALELLLTLPESKERDRQELKIRISSGRPLLVEGFTSTLVERNALRIIELARAAGDDVHLWQALYELGRNASQRNDFDRGRILAQEMIRIGERIGDDLAIAAGVYTMGTSTMLRGEFSAAKRELDRGLILSVSPEEQRQIGDHFQAAIGYRFSSALVHWSLGYPVQARELAKDALEQARAIDSPFALEFALQRSAICRQFEHSFGPALEASTEFIELHGRYPAHQWLPWVLFVRAWALMRTNELTEAHAAMDEAWPLWHRRRSEYLGPYFRCLAAEVHLAAGQLEKAQMLLAEAFELCVSTDQHHWKAELHRARASLLLARSAGCEAEAQHELEAALGLTRTQSAKSLELRAARNLAKLWAEQGQRQRAHDLLTPIFDWFTEGFDFPDLVAAKALLDELR